MYVWRGMVMYVWRGMVKCVWRGMVMCVERDGYVCAMGWCVDGGMCACIYVSKCPIHIQT